MDVLLGIVLQMVGFYALYGASARACFVKRRHHRYLYAHRRLSTALGSLLVSISFAVFMLNLGIGVGFFFALISLMAVSGFTIVLIPLQRASK